MDKPVTVLLCLLSLHGWCGNAHKNGTRNRPPNIILFLADDFGYGDLSVYGHSTQERGRIDRMAAEGLRFTQFYSMTVFCTPSRTAMLTGRYAMRSGMDGSNAVHLPCSNHGLPHSEVTMAEVLKQAGYTTGMVGKWHQGINAYSHDDGFYLPHSHGFDFVGHNLPHTLVWDCDTCKRHRKHPKCTKCFLFKNTTITQQPIRLETLTTTLLHDAKAFLYENKDRPLFLYYSFPQTHTPMYNMEEFRDKSRRGIYGDQVNEMAWSVGEILDLMRELGLENDTLSVFTSDHGPHIEMCEEGGSTGILKGGKGNFFEGGIRIPAIFHWPGTVPGGVTSASVVTLMDLFPTFAELGGTDVPTDRVIDGRSFAQLLRPSSGSPIHLDQGHAIPGHQQQTYSHGNPHNESYDQKIHDILFFHCMDRKLMAVRYKQFKVHFHISDPKTENGPRMNCNGGFPVRDYYHSVCLDSMPLSEPLVYDLERDPGETFPLNLAEHEDMMSEVMTLIQGHRETLGDLPPSVLMSKHCNKRYIPCCNPPYCVCMSKN